MESGENQGAFRGHKTTGAVCLLPRRRKLWVWIWIMELYGAVTHILGACRVGSETPLNHIRYTRLPDLSLFRTTLYIYLPSFLHYIHTNYFSFYFDSLLIIYPCFSSFHTLSLSVFFSVSCRSLFILDIHVRHFFFFPICTEPFNLIWHHEKEPP